MLIKTQGEDTLGVFIPVAQKDASCSVRQLSCKAKLYSKSYENLDETDSFFRKSPTIKSSYVCSNSCTGATDIIKTRYQVEPFWVENQSTLAMEGVNITETKVWVSHRAEWKTNITVEVNSFNPTESRHSELIEWANRQAGK